MYKCVCPQIQNQMRLYKGCRHSTLAKDLQASFFPFCRAAVWKLLHLIKARLASAVLYFIRQLYLMVSTKAIILAQLP